MKIFFPALHAFIFILLLSFTSQAQTGTALTTVSIGSGENTGEFFPIFTSEPANYSQTIYTADELIAGGAPAGGGIIKKLRWRAASSGSTTNFNGWIVSLGKTTKNAFNEAEAQASRDWVKEANLSTVFSGPLPVTNLTKGDWLELTLQVPFFWDGVSNLVVCVWEAMANLEQPTYIEWYSYTAAPAAGTKGLFTLSLNTYYPKPASQIQEEEFGYGWNTVAQIQLEVETCTVAPQASISSNVTSICENTSFQLTAAPAGIGQYTYQFQSSSDGVNWSNIGVAGSSNTHTVATQSATTHYRVQVSCSGYTGTSGAVTVARKNCYCTPAYNITSCTQGYGIKDFVLNGAAGTSINHVNSGCSPGGYGNFTDMSVSLAQNTSYNGTITKLSNGQGLAYRIWIDLNDNGRFESSESITAGGTVSFTLAIPAGALPGTYRMRVRTADVEPASIDPCAYTAYGETHDYTVTIVAAPACSGVPQATISSSQTSVCKGVAFTLTAALTGTSGVSYQFQSSADGNTWHDLGLPGPANTYNILSQETATYYRVLVHCSGQTGISTPVFVASELCYCAPAYSMGCANGDVITRFRLGSLDNNTGTTCSSNPRGYSNYTSLSTDLVQGSSYTATIQTGAGSLAGQGVAVWIDFNDNELFEETEKFYTSTNIPYGGTGSILITVPADAAPGVHRLRVRLVDETSGSAIEPCSSYAWGETEDYTVRVLAPVACNGLPAAPTVQASLAAACPDRPILLTATGLPGIEVAGIKYQWQKAAAGSGVFTDIAGAIGSSWTISSQAAAADYRLVVTCEAGGTTISEPVQVAQYLSGECACVPVGFNPSYGYIAGFTSSGGVTNIDHNSAYNDLGYEDFYSTHSASAYAGSTVNYTITVAEAQNYMYALWLDLNTDGLFSPNERIAVNFAASGSQLTGSFTIPEETVPGKKRLRIMVRKIEIPLNFDACTVGSTFGDFEDYSFIVMEGGALPVLLRSFSANNEGQRNRIRWQSSMEANLSHYELERSPDGNQFTPFSRTNANNRASDYVAFDNQPYAGLTYYRLKTVDEDGSFNYSKTVLARSKTSGFTITAFPNPVSELLTVQVAGAARNATLQLTDVAGRVLAQTKVVDGAASFAVGALAQGIYFLRYADGVRVETIKVHKK